MQPSTIRVFISSTFRDMHAERDYLARFVFPELRDRCRKRGLDFIDIDLRWGVTEEEAKRGGALDICLEEIERSRPFFIGLLGERYGWVPLPPRIPTEKWDRFFPTLSIPDQILLLSAYEPDGPRYLLKEGINESTEATVFDLFDRYAIEPFDIPEGVPDDKADPFEWMKTTRAGHSVTAMEIMHGVLKNPQMKHRSFFYFRNPAFAGEVPEMFRSSVLAENPVSTGKLAHLKQEIRELYFDLPANITDGYTCNYKGIRVLWREAEYPLKGTLSPEEFDDLELKTGQDYLLDVEEWNSLSAIQRDAVLPYGTVALQDLDELGADILRDLWTSIEAEFPESEQITDPLDIEIAAHLQILEEKTRYFVGREDLIRQLTESETGTTPDGKPTFRPVTVLTGDSGSGKSALMAMAVKRMQEKYPSATVLYRFVGTSPKSQQLPDVLKSVVAELGRLINQPLQEEDLKDYEKLKDRFRQLPGEVAARTGQPVFLLLDALNQLGAAGDPERPDWIPVQTAPGVAVCLSLIPCPLFDNLKGRQYPVVIAGSLTPAECRELLTKTLAFYRKQLTDDQLTSILMKKEVGSPLYLQVVADELRSYPRFETVDQRIRLLPNTLGALFEQVFDRLETDHGQTLVRDALCLLHTSLYGLKEAELADLLARPGENRLPDSVLVPLLRNLGLWLHQAGKEGLLTFMHHHLRQAVTHRYQPATDPSFLDRLFQYSVTVSKLADGPDATGDLTNCGKYPAVYALRLGQLSIVTPILEMSFSKNNWDSYQPVANEWAKEVLMTNRIEDPKNLTVILDALPENEITASWIFDCEIYFAPYIPIHYRYVFVKRCMDIRLTNENEVILNLSNSNLISYPKNINFLVDKFYKYSIKQQNLRISLDRLGDLFSILGDHTAAGDLFTRSLAIAESLASRDPENTDKQRDVSVSLYKMGDLANSLSDLPTALNFYSRSLSIAETLVSKDPENVNKQRDLSVSLERMGDQSKAFGDLTAAQDFFTRSLAIAETLVRKDPENAEKQKALSGSLNKMGDLSSALGDLTTARNFYTCSLLNAETLVSRDPENAEKQRDLSILLEQMGDLSTSLGDLGAARDFFAKSLAIFETLVSHDMDNPEIRHKLCSVLIKMGKTSQDLGDLSSAQNCFSRSGVLSIILGDNTTAKDLFSRSLAIAESLTSKDPENADKLRNLSGNLERMGDLYKSLGDLDSAQNSYSRSLYISETLVSWDPENTVKQLNLSVSLERMGDLSKSLGDLTAARDFYSRSLDIREILTSKDSENADKQQDSSENLNNIADLYTSFDNLSKSPGNLTAVRDFNSRNQKNRDAFASWGSEIAEKHQDSSNSLNKMGDLSNTLGDLSNTLSDLPTALNFYTRSLSIAETLVSRDPENAEKQQNLSSSLNKMGELSKSLGDLTVARDFFTRSLTIMETIAKRDLENATNRKNISSVLIKIGKISKDLGDLSAARDFFTRSLSIAETLANRGPENADTLRDLNDRLNNMGDLSTALGDLTAARNFYNHSLSIAETLSSQDPENTYKQRRLYVSLIIMGDLTKSLGDLLAARDFFSRSLAIAETLSSRDPENEDKLQDLSVSLDRMGNLSIRLGDLTDAHDFFARCLAISKNLFYQNFANVFRQENLILRLNAMSEISYALGDLEGAYDFLSNSLNFYKDRFAWDSDNVDRQRQLSIYYMALGDISKALCNLKEARSFYARCISIRENHAKKDPENQYKQRDLCQILDRLGEISHTLGDLFATNMFFSQSLEIFEILAAKNPENADIQQNLAIRLERMGNLCTNQGDLTTARNFFTRSLTIRETLASQDPENADKNWNFSSCQINKGDPSKALGDLTYTQNFLVGTLSTHRCFTKNDPQNRLYNKITIEGLIEVMRLPDSDWFSEIPHSLAHNPLILNGSLEKSTEFDEQYLYNLYLMISGLFHLKSSNREKGLNTLRSAHVGLLSLVKNNKRPDLFFDLLDCRYRLAYVLSDLNRFFELHPLVQSSIQDLEKLEKEGKLREHVFAHKWLSFFQEKAKEMNIDL